MKDLPGRCSPAKSDDGSEPLSISDLLPPVGGRIIADTFRRMTIAEEEIRAAKARHPEKAAKLDKAFRYLCPPALLNGLDDQLYRAHCKEILDREAKGEKLRRGTAAEVVAALSQGSQVAPLGRIETLLYTQLFEEIFPEDASRILGDGRPAAPDLYERARMRDLEQELRRKLACDRGALE